MDVLTDRSLDGSAEGFLRKIRLQKALSRDVYVPNSPRGFLGPLQGGGNQQCCRG